MSILHLKVHDSIENGKFRKQHIAQSPLNVEIN